MNLDLIIQQLKTYAPIFETRVAGAADFSTGIETTTNMPLPSAYVIPLGDDAEPNVSLNALYQTVKEHIGVCVIFDSSADRRGQTSVDQVEATKYQIFAAILNWRNDPIRAARSLQYEGAKLLEFDRARLFYQWEFSLEVTIDDEDGFQVPSAPLEEIDLYPNGEQALDVQKIVLPQ